MTTTWTVVTYNMGGRAKARDVVELIELAERETPNRWTLALQETADQRATLRDVVDRIARRGRRRAARRARRRDVELRAAVAARADVELVQGPEGLGRSKLATITPLGTLRHDGLRKLTDRTFVGDPGAGGPFTDHKYLLRTRQRAGGTSLRVGNVHLISSVQGSPTPWRKLRRTLHRRQLTRSLAWADNTSLPTVIVGDYNTTPPSSLLDPIRRRGWRVQGVGSFGGPDKDRRPIDLLTIRQVKRIKVTRIRTRKLGSDHRAVIWTLSIDD